MTIELKWQTIEVGLVPGSLSVRGLNELGELGERFVYVIETPTSRGINYAKGVSNVCYIGRQGKRDRGCRPLTHAKGWIAKSLVIGLLDEPYLIHVAHPRRQRLADAFKDIEGFLIEEFDRDFGSLPLFNKNRPTPFGNYDVVTNAPFLENEARRLGAIHHPSSLDQAVKE